MHARPQLMRDYLGDSMGARMTFFRKEKEDVLRMSKGE